MITETREVYKCEHCRKMYQIKSACERHEPKCRKNPDNYQKCLDGCIHLVKKEISWTIDTCYGEEEKDVEILYCECKKEGVHPYWVRGYLSDDLGDETPNNPMPEECKLFQLI